jgi:hypothetical protein
MDDPIARPLTQQQFIDGLSDYIFTFAGYALKAGQLTYDCRYSTMHGMPVTGGRGFRSLKHWGITVSRLKWVPRLPLKRRMGRPC